MGWDMAFSNWFDDTAPGQRPRGLVEHETQDVRRWWEHQAVLRRLGDGVLVGGLRVWVLILLRLGCCHPA